MTYNIEMFTPEHIARLSNLHLLKNADYEIDICTLQSHYHFNNIFQQPINLMIMKHYILPLDQVHMHTNCTLPIEERKISIHRLWIVSAR